mmetsp:Transcript_60785/g.174285  ORF Transcript_60785/g.174285 Transcript_60785/m.174285 type:complete len:297 (+) Transcript_60785:756-1646(+)
MSADARLETCLLDPATTVRIHSGHAHRKDLVGDVPVALGGLEDISKHLADLILANNAAGSVAVPHPDILDRVVVQSRELVHGEVLRTLHLAGPLRQVLVRLHLGQPRYRSVPSKNLISRACLPVLVRHREQLDGTGACGAYQLGVALIQAVDQGDAAAHLVPLLQGHLRNVLNEDSVECVRHHEVVLGSQRLVAQIREREVANLRRAAAARHHDSPALRLQGGCRLLPGAAQPLELALQQGGAAVIQGRDEDSSVVFLRRGHQSVVSFGADGMHSAEFGQQRNERSKQLTIQAVQV